MARYALIDSRGNVQNVVEWDGQSAWSAPSDLTAIVDDNNLVGPGWSYASGRFSPPPSTAPPPMVADPELTYLQFRALFTAAENQAIMTAAQSNHAVLDWLLQAAGAGAINLADPQVKAGLDALVAAGLITAARESAIVANQPPPQ